MSNQELLGFWLSDADYSQYDAEVNTDVKAFAPACNLEGHLDRKIYIMQPFP